MSAWLLIHSGKRCAVENIASIGSSLMRMENLSSWNDLTLGRVVKACPETLFPAVNIPKRAEAGKAPVPSISISNSPPDDLHRSFIFKHSS